MAKYRFLSGISLIIITLFYCISVSHAASPNSLSSSSNKTFDSIFLNLGNIKDASQAKPKSVEIKRGKSVKSTNQSIDLSVTVDPLADPKQKMLPYQLTRTLNQAYDALDARKYKQAIKLFTIVLRSEPDYIPALLGVAHVYHKQKKMARAGEIYGEILKIQPSHLGALNNFFAINGELAPEATLQQLQRLVAAAPELALLHAQIAVIYYNNGQLLKAAKAIKQAIIHSPYNFTYRYNFAIMLDMLGKRDKAITAYEQLLFVNVKGYEIPGSASQINERLSYLRAQ